MWTPDLDASNSPINYVINATVKTGTKEPVSKTVQHPSTIATFTELPQYSTGSVSVQARNSGAWSKIVTKKFRMVNITGEGGYLHLD